MNFKQQEFICEGKSVKLPISLRSKFLEELYEDDDTIVELDFLRYDFMMIFNRYYNNITEETNDIALEKTGHDIYYINSLVGTYLQIDKIHSIRTNNNEIIKVQVKYYPSNYLFVKDIRNMNFDDRFISLDIMSRNKDDLLKEENYEYFLTKRDNFSLIQYMWNYAIKNDKFGMLFFIIDFTRFYTMENIIEEKGDILDKIVNNTNYFN